MKIDWMAIAAISIQSAVTLLSSYWQVKTMRALTKLHTKQPTDTDTTRVIKWGSFLKKSTFLLMFNFVLLSTIIIFELSLSGPISRLSIFLIVLSFCLVLYNIITHIIFKEIIFIYKSFSRIVGIVEPFIDAATIYAQHVFKSENKAKSNNKNVE